MIVRVAVAVAVAATLLWTGAAPAAEIDVERLAGLKARSIGPAGMSGRVAAIDAVESDPDVVWVGAATGGVWKSTNGGLTWKPVFDDQPVAAIGALAVFQPNPAIVWVGTGEGNVRNSASVGDGVWRTVDGGETWKHVGLQGTERIHRIVLHPTDPDVAWAAALGREWGENPERGIFKTIDGGRSWRKVLYVDEKTGGADLVLDRAHPHRLLASTWQFRRWPWRFESGGPGSGLWRSHDGGESWQRLQVEDGLPEGDLGRIGLAISRSNPEVAYALVEAKKSALLRSEDGGATWKSVNAKPDVNPRPFYFGELRVDPRDPNRVYSLDYTVRVSTDGGRSFRTIVRWDEIHGDHHALWIDPANPEHLYVGDDGGVAVSEDGGRTNRFVSNLPLAQFYHVAYDLDVPYNLYGGLQDNGSWRGPSSVRQQGGIRNHHWKVVGGGDGFETRPDPSDSSVGYAMWQGGNLMRWNLRTAETKDVKPAPPEGVELRFNWNAGFAVDPFAPATIYLGSQFVHRSTDRGETWTTISPDLTTNDARHQRQATSGGLTPDVTGAENFTTVIAIAPSPRARGVIWVGTDDGRLHVTRDGGGTWTSVEKNLRGVPAGTWIPHVVPSSHADGTAFVVLDNHRRSDWKPYVQRTDDFGATWRDLGGRDLRGYALALAQDPVDPDLLFVGTEFGLWVSFDGGRGWQRWKHGVPTVSVMDLAIHPRDHDLIVATHGRALYVLDDLGPLRHLKADDLSAPLHLFFPGDAAQFRRLPEDGGFGLGAGEFRGENRAYGALVTFAADAEDLPVADAKLERERKELERRRQRAEAAKRAEKEGAEGGAGAESVAAEPAGPADPAEGAKAAEEPEKPETKATIEILDAAGARVRRERVKVVRGVNRWAWDLGRDPLRRPPSDDEEEASEEGSTRSGPEVPPGRYEVVVRFRGVERRAPLTVVADPSSRNSEADWQARWRAVQEAGALHEATVAAVDRLRAVRADIEAARARVRSEHREELSRGEIEEKALPLAAETKPVLERLEKLERRFWQSPETVGIVKDDDVLSALYYVRGYLDSSWDPPSATHLEYLRQARAKLGAALEELARFESEQVAPLRARLAAAGVGLLPERPPLALP